MSEWRNAPLSSLADGGASGIAGGPFGSALGRKDYRPSGVPVIRGAQLNGGSRFTHADLVFVSEEKADRHRRNLAGPGDVIVTQRGTLGQVGIVPLDSSYERYLLSQSQMKITVDMDVAVPAFIYYALRSPETVSRLENHALVAGVPHINLGILRDFEIRVPPRRTQRRIAHLLAAFDELIEINERRIELLDDLARSLYREWFVRRKLPGLAGSAGRWTVRNLFDVADVGFGYSFKSAGFGPKGPHGIVRIRDVPRAQTRTFTGESAPDRYAVRDGDILLGMDGEFHLNLWSGGDAWLNQRVARLRAVDGVSNMHVKLAIAEPISALNRSIVGTTVAHLGKRHLEQIELPMPPSEALVEATQAFDVIGDSVVSLRRQVRSLARTRDLLLPRLVSGRLDISEVDLGDLLRGEDGV